MGNALNFDDYLAMGLQIQHYVLTHVLVWNMLVQLIVVGCLYILARLTAGAVGPWLRRLLKRHPLVQHSLPHLTRVITTRLVTPIITIMLLWFAHRAAGHFHWPNHGIRIFLGLFLAWVIIRLLTSQMENRTLARSISFIIWFVAALNIVHLLRPFMALLNSIDLTVIGVHLTLLSVIEGGVLLVALFWLAKKISIFFEQWIKTVEHVTPSAQVLLHKLLTFALFTLVALAVLYYLGFNFTALAVFSGAIGLGLGFGLQKVFANLISGLIILADKSIKPGDVIQLGDTHGYINFLGSRYVSVVTRDATEYLIPNEDLVTSQVINWSHSSDLVRLKIPIGIGYNSDVQKAMDLMLEAAAGVDRILTDPKPACLLMGFGENSINFQLRVWIHDPQNGVHNVKSQILLGIWKRFKQHDITLPFPQRVLHHQSAPELEVSVRTQEPAAALNPTA